MNSRALTIQLLQQLMVLSGLTFQQFARTVLMLLSVVAFTANAQTNDVTGTMPEDYLPELKTILVTALTRSPKVLGPLFEIEQKQANRIHQNSARLPSLGGSINYGTTELSESGNSNSSSRDQGLFYSVGLNQAIFHWGALKNQSAIANINVMLAEKNYAKVYRDLGVLIRQLYLDLIVRKARLRQEREGLRLQRENINVLLERVASGQATTADVSGEQHRIREVTLALNRSEEELVTARRTFSRIAGIGELSESAIPTELPRPAYSDALTTAISAALLRDGAKGTLEAEIHDLRVREAQHRYNIAKVGLLPKFNAGAGYSLENTTTVGTSVGQKAVARQTLSIGASWPIFDGFATRAAKMEAKAVQRLYTDRRQMELDELLESAQALERHLKLDAEQLDLAEVRVSMATQMRGRAEEESKLDNVPKNMVARAQLGILLAEAGNFAARAAFLVRWSEFVAIAGNDPVLNNLPVSHVRPKK